MVVLARFLFFAMSGCAVCHAALPPYIKPCKKSLNLSDCIKENIEAVKPYLRKGVPELYVVPLDPWKYPSIKMTLPFLRLDAYDIYAWKMDTAIVKEVNLSLDDGNLDIAYNFPYFWAEGKYDIDGNLFLFQVDADGYGNGTLSDVDVKLKLKGKPKVVNGKSYMEFEKTGFDWTIKGGATVYLRDIFPGNPILSNQLNKILTSRAVEFFYLVQPIMEIIVTDFVEEAIKGVFNNYPLDELFVD